MKISKKPKIYQLLKVANPLKYVKLLISGVKLNDISVGEVLTRIDCWKVRRLLCSVVLDIVLRYAANLVYDRCKR